MIQEQMPVETKETSSLDLLKNYADYNLWANQTLIKWLETKDELLLEKKVPSSFPSIKLTLAHLCEIENYWLSILNASTYEHRDNTNDSLETIFNNLLDVSSQLAAFVNSQSEAQVQEKTLIESPWFTCDFKHLEYIMHTVNHGTYHRGQIVSIGRNLGFTDAPMTDYNFYNIKAK